MFPRTSRVAIFCGLHLLYVFLSAATAAHLPAVRKPAIPSEQKYSKRVLASRLIRSADRHKEGSLRDVLGESDRTSEEEVRREDMPKSAREKETADLGPSDRLKLGSMSDLFAWAVNNTVSIGGTNYSSKLFAHVEVDDGPRERGGRTASMHVGKVELSREGAEGAAEKILDRQMLPQGDARKVVRATHEAKRKRAVERAAEKAAEKAQVSGEEVELLSSAAESEFDVIKRNVNVLDADGVSKKQAVSALLMLEELCHSIDNGRDLQISGGISPVMKALRSRHEAVRSSAAWALATCCQNNPPVQNASVELDAVPVLSRLAAHDRSPEVRSKALFALNAMLEMEGARESFEELPFAIDVVKNALVDSSDFRATRRALNLIELLVQKNLDAWKTQLEAWDIPVLIEGLMRSHQDTDVRLSAARTIAALDGRTVA